jgi:glyoxylase-like metal-dependent hydrolase (beta-lactamase superfamily II)
MPDRAPQVTGVFDPITCSFSYVVADPVSGRAVLIDPVLDFEAKAARTTTATADKLAAAAEGRTVEWILETHAHADHLTAAAYLKQKLGCRTGTGEHVRSVQRAWKDILNLDEAFVCDGSQFDHLFAEGERFSLGELTVTVWHTPGHTPGCVTYVVSGAEGPASAFIGDTMFMPDCGTARADFPGGDAGQLFRSIRRILSLPADTRLFVAHDYPPQGRVAACETTVAEQRRANLHVKDGTEEAAFVAFRTARDKTLGQPTLLLPSIQLNIRAGALPPPEPNGISYLKIPLNRF